MPGFIQFCLTGGPWLPKEGQFLLRLGYLADDVGGKKY